MMARARAIARAEAWEFLLYQASPSSSTARRHVNTSVEMVAAAAEARGTTRSGRTTAVSTGEMMGVPPRHHKPNPGDDGGDTTTTTTTEDLEEWVKEATNEGVVEDGVMEMKRGRRGLAERAAGRRIRARREQRAAEREAVMIAVEEEAERRARR